MQKTWKISSSNYYTENKVLQAPVQIWFNLEFEFKFKVQAAGMESIQWTCEKQGYNLEVQYQSQVQSLTN